MKRMEKCRVKWGLVTILGIALSSCILLGGCRLAKEEESAFGGDQLIGMLVTTQGPSEENVLQKSGEQEKLEGVENEQGWYEFPQVVGAAITREYDEENDAVGVQGPEGWFSDIHLNVNVSGEGECHEYSGVLYISSEFNETLYFCPVYEREDGSVYAAMTGDRYYFLKKYFGIGETISKSVKEQLAVTKDGKKETESVSFTVHVKREAPLEEMVLLEMNRDHEVIGETAVEEEQDALKLQPETSYVIAEMTCRNMEGGTDVHRVVYDVGEEENEGILRPYEDENHLIYWKMLKF